MSVFHALVNAVKTAWRGRRGGLRTRRRALATLERLDHRQLLSVTFTGNAKADIPDPPAPGVAIVRNDTRIPIANPVLANLIKVSGFDVNAIRMKYTPEDDVLSFALEQPGNQKTSPEFPVIAGDADNNLNGGTVSPAVLAVQPLFRDYPSLGVSETMAIFLDLNNDNIPDVVAGISNDPGVPKLYQVAEAVVNPDPVIAATTAPAFGTPLQDNTGFSFLNDQDPTQGAFEFQVTNFSQLYRAETGQDLTASTIFQVGGFAGSPDDFISELFIRAQPVNLGVGPTPPPVCPPLNPPVLVNPHFNRHVNTAHPNYVRVNVFGTSGFDVKRIIRESVRFGGAAPEFSFNRKVNRDNFLDATFVFRGDELDLPAGQTNATISGLYDDPSTGQDIPFSSSTQVFVRDRASFSGAERAAQNQRLNSDANPLRPVPELIRERAAAGGVALDMEPGTSTALTRNASGPATVRITARRHEAHSERRERTPSQQVIHRAAGFRRQGQGLREAKGADSRTDASADAGRLRSHLHDLALDQVARSRH